MIRIYLLLLCFSFYSCATLINKEQTRIEVHTFPDSSFICLDNGTCVKSPVILEVPRSYNDFEFIVRNDSTKKKVRIKSMVAPEYKWGNLLFIYYCPIGYIVDASSRNKIYSYSNSIKVDLSSKKEGYQKFKASKKGQWYFRSSLPWFDFIEFDNGRGFENYKSYMGLTIGLDYYHSKQSYLSLSGGATGISDLGFPVMDRSFDTTQFVKSFSAVVTNNHNLKIFTSENIGFTVGYGLSFTHFRFREVANDTIQNQYAILYKNSKSALGLCFNANVILFKHGFVGVNILPSYYTLKTNKWEYSNLTYFDFGVRLPLGNYEKDKHRVVKYKPKLIE